LQPAETTNGVHLAQTADHMKVLFVTPYVPSPPTFGGQRRIHGLMRALSKRHALSLLALHNPIDPIDAWLERTRVFYPDTELFVQPAFGLQGRAKRTAQLRSLFALRSWDAISHRNEAMVSRLRERLARETWDAMVVEFGQMTVNLTGLPRSVPCVIDEHNVEYDLQRRSASSSLNPLRRTFLEANWRKLRREEVAVWRTFEGVSVTSPRDLAIVKAHAPQARCVLAPNGVDLDEFTPPPGPPEPDTVIFVGAHNYFPNADGLRFLLAEIWPLVLLARPSARLRVVGPSPPADIVALQPPNVVFEGYVTDIITEVGRAAVAIAPLRVGGGTRLKIVEAMALARPVVATSIGAEGIEVQHGRDILLADAPRDFAAAVLRMLAHPAEATALGLRGRRLVEQAYGWDASAARLEHLLKELVERRQQEPPLPQA
jgi:glycosyltransferase involved in cell wall biosynthesis